MGPVLVVKLVKVVVDEVTNPPPLSATTPTPSAPKERSKTTSERILLLNNLGLLAGKCYLGAVLDCRNQVIAGKTIGQQEQSPQAEKKRLKTRPSGNIRIESF